MAGQLAWVDGGEAETDRAGPALRLLDEPDENFLVHPHWPVGEDNRFAEAFNPAKWNISLLVGLCFNTLGVVDSLHEAVFMEAERDGVERRHK